MHGSSQDEILPVSIPSSSDAEQGLKHRGKEFSVADDEEEMILSGAGTGSVPGVERASSSTGRSS
ncbi:hypothetical protein HDU97_003458 [Phlyctochytrium planicorne]|nr:hypothetical protein HDU97_003458 [Phlyctochytrium planicorne]